MKRNSMTEFENIYQDAGIIDDPNKGKPFKIDGCNGTSIAIAMSAFASAPPKISRS